MNYKVPEVEVDNDVKSYLDRFNTDKKSGFRRAQNQMIISGIMINVNSNIRTSMFSMDGRSGPQLRKHFTQLVIYKDNIVATKSLPENFNHDELLRKEKLELKAMMELKHRNVQIFHGLSSDGNLYSLLQEYGVRGSLRNILQNKVQLTWEVKRSLCNDIVDGMAYIHASSLGYHGFLNTTACIVTGRMEVKVGNFGVQRIRSQARSTKKSSDEMEHLNLWQAPEILANPSLNDPIALQKADIYSYAIITHEVFYEMGPFWLGPSTSPPNISSLIDNIREGRLDIYGKEARPFVLNNEYDHCKLCNIHLSSSTQFRSSREWINIVVRCWNQNPALRYSFQRIKKMRTQGMVRTNIVDDLSLRLQEYTDKLEQEVDKQTKHLAKEKENSARLVMTLLPQVVADELTEGNSYPPVDYESVSMYQSDIVGFTNIGTKSNPIQIMTMLKDMYEVFDSIVNKFDVYKVETIGDAYVAVSGAPSIDESCNHASQICQFSLGVQRAIDVFKIAHLPEEKLKIRSGVHTGPIVGGVVGQSMPRWCLFGTTRDLCEKLESSGKADAIHVSEATYKFLRRDPSRNWTFALTERIEQDPSESLIALTKEVSKTYWLVNAGNSRPTVHNLKVWHEVFPRSTRTSMRSTIEPRSTRRSSMPNSLHSAGSFIYKTMSQAGSHAGSYDPSQNTVLEAEKSDIRHTLFGSVISAGTSTDELFQTEHKPCHSVIHWRNLPPVKFLAKNKRRFSAYN